MKDNSNNNFVEDVIYIEMCDKILLEADIHKNRNFSFDVEYDNQLDTLPIATPDEKRFKALAFSFKDYVRRFMEEEKYIYQISNGFFRLTSEGEKAKEKKGHIKYKKWKNKRDNIIFNNLTWTKVAAIAACVSVLAMIFIEVVKGCNQ